MLFLFFLGVTAFWNVNALSNSEDDDGLLVALDRELEDFLVKAIDDLPKKLKDDELQHIEGSGIVDPVAITRTSLATHEAKSRQNTTVAPSTSNRTESHEVDSEAVLAQLLSSIALAAEVPLEPSVNKVVEKLLQDATHSEMKDLLANSTTEPPKLTSTTTTATTTTSSTTFTTSTSTVPTTTTTRSALKTVRDTNGSLVECEEEATCYTDSDCGKGSCLGVFLGKCNCHACIANINCDGDSDCGGLRKACQNGICRCAQALVTHGFPLYIDALTKFCSQRSCTETSDSCFGLPCGRGICSCK
ncbi:hypothetical protein Y032_0019g3938 [Ancylostoma ceylanicum]|uniref:Chondroitin proteoglycan 3 n=1 Tax=Ancylostoma ceylanicum TaxID=53326 RepID=A0A016V3R1_9BILA|nr:hypothetical protein Y032_0019g3938 [Ancylostoma ceylanicum]